MGLLRRVLRVGPLASASEFGSKVSFVSCCLSVLFATAMLVPAAATAGAMFRSVAPLAEHPLVGSHIRPYRVSADGTTVVGESSSAGPEYLVGVRWTLAEGLVQMESPPGGETPWYAHGVSGDDSIITGEATTAAGIGEAYRWTASGGTVPLGGLPGAVPAY